MRVTVIGAGLAGSECAWQLAQRGIDVTLCEMKPEKKTPAHLTEHFAELCCSNSLRSDQLENAVGLLKEEMRRLGSLILIEFVAPLFLVFFSFLVIFYLRKPICLLNYFYLFWSVSFCFFNDKLPP